MFKQVVSFTLGGVLVVAFALGGFVLVKDTISDIETRPERIYAEQSVQDFDREVRDQMMRQEMALRELYQIKKEHDMAKLQAPVETSQSETPPTTIPSGEPLFAETSQEEPSDVESEVQEEEVQNPVSEVRTSRLYDPEVLAHPNVYLDDEGQAIYTIQRYDTLTQISAWMGFSVDEIANYNEIRDANIISEGASLRVPLRTEASE